jgi:hypothetical protein
MLKPHLFYRCLLSAQIKATVPHRRNKLILLISTCAVRRADVSEYVRYYLCPFVVLACSHTLEDSWSKDRERKAFESRASPSCPSIHMSFSCWPRSNSQGPGERHCAWNTIFWIRMVGGAVRTLALAEVILRKELCQHRLLLVADPCALQNRGARRSRNMSLRPSQLRASKRANCIFD